MAVAWTCAVSEPPAVYSAFVVLVVREPGEVPYQNQVHGVPHSRSREPDRDWLPGAPTAAAPSVVTLVGATDTSAVVRAEVSSVEPALLVAVTSTAR